MKDIKREFLSGPRKFDEIMEKLEIIVNEIMRDVYHGHDTKSTQGESDMSNDMSYEDKGAGTEWARTMASWTRS